MREVMITQCLRETEAENANNLFQVPELVGGRAQSLPALCSPVHSVGKGPAYRS